MDNLNVRLSRGGGRHELVLRVASALILAPLAIAVAYAGGWLFVLFWGAAALGIFWEWTSLVVAGRMVRTVFTVGATVLVLAALLAGLGGYGMAIGVAAIGIVLTGFAAPANRRWWAAAGLVYAAAALMAPVVLRIDSGYGFTAILLLFAIVWATDIFGFFGGRLFGGPKLWPRVSPKKTWSGAIAGTIAAVIAVMVLASAVALNRLALVGAGALALSIVAQAGDLMESAIKRRFGAKDTGRVIPGHGGLMDRLDGFVAAASAAAVFAVARGGLNAPAASLLVWQ